jgi:hypothetical protein
LGQPEVDELVAAFGAELRRLRIEAGEPAFRSRAHSTGYGRTTLHDALQGNRLPTLDVTLGLVRALGGNEDEWRARWVSVRGGLDARRPSAPAPTPDSDVPALESPDGAPSRPDEAEPDTDGHRPGRRRRAKKLLLAGIAGTLLIVVAVLVVNLATGNDPTRLVRDRCEQVRQYRLTASGNVLASNGELVGTVVPGDLFKAQRTNGAPYFTHRYYGFVLRTGTWGYVDQSKLKFLTQTCL